MYYRILSMETLNGLENALNTINTEYLFNLLSGKKICNSNKIGIIYIISK